MKLGLAITLQKRKMKSDSKLENDQKYHLELFCHWGHVCATKIDPATTLNSSFLTSASNHWNRCLNSHMRTHTSSLLDDMPKQQGSPLAYSVDTNDDVPCFGDTLAFERSLCSESSMIVLQSLH